MSMSEQPKNLQQEVKAAPTGGEAKIAEYARRFLKGEQYEEIIKGLPHGMRDAFDTSIVAEYVNQQMNGGGS